MILILVDGLNTFFPDQVDANRRPMAEKVIRQLEGEVLPAYMPGQRWFAAKGEKIEGITLEKHGLWTEDGHNWLFIWPRVQFAGIEPQRYFQPLDILWETADNDEEMRALLPATLARVRHQARAGILYDAYSNETFCRALIKTIGEGKEVPMAGGTLKFAPTAAFASLAGEDLDQLAVRRSTAGSSNTGIFLGERLFMKGYRRMQSGINPELEMGRFLTETSPFANIVPVAGTLEYIAPDGTPTALVMVQGYVINQGDAWAYTLDYLERTLEQIVLQSPEVSGVPEEDLHGLNLMMMKTLGQRTGELHVALSKQSGDPAFDPEPVSTEDMTSWNKQIREEAGQSLDKLERSRNLLPEGQRVAADRLLAARRQILDRIAALEPQGLQVAKTRFHGDYHLGQVLVAEDDFVIIDFEGEPARSLEERRSKHSPLKDVAGMLRSFNYAAYATLFKMVDEKIADFEHLEPLAREWERQAAEAFMSGYEEAVAGCASYPRNHAHARNLIDLFAIEKAFYELRYELDNRPGWIGVPLGGLLELLV
jgi:maltose alpha-D-glucosyltransferase/alpha-amylase